MQLHIIWELYGAGNNKSSDPKASIRYVPQCPLEGAGDLVSRLSVELLLGGSWDLVSTVISTINGVISRYKYSYLNYNPSY